MSDFDYETAQICLNGHVVNSRGESRPESRSAYCSNCGEQAIAACPDCRAAIRGKLTNSRGQQRALGFSAPKFCHSCGKPYPWTVRKTEALNSAIDQLEIAPDERAKLKQAVPDLIQDTPKTSVAAGLFGQALKKTKEVGGKVLSDVLVKVATEGALILTGLKPPV